MKLVKMVRSEPEVKGGPVACDIQLCDIESLKSRGWLQEGDVYEQQIAPAEPNTELIDKAVELGLGSVSDLASLTSEEIEALISKSLDLTKDEDFGGEKKDKEALVAKLLALKETNPKAVKAAPSQIPTMSVEKLTALLTEAEEAIKAEAAQAGQE